MAITLAVLFLCLSLVSLASKAAALPWIQTAPAGDAHFYDEFGRVRIFHGSNRVAKESPWYFEDMLHSETEFRLMKKMGFNVMRLGFMWTGYNPKEGFFNQTYIDTIKAIARRMANHGVYTLLDVHEDILSSKFCTYDGVPRWVVDKSIPKHPFPWPLTGNCSSRNWMANALTEAAAQAYQDFYDNRDGMLDNFRSFWEHAAQQFRDEPSIIGYELMNEPFAGNFYADPLLLLPGVAGRRNLQRMHDAVARTIRTQDQQHIIFYEPVTWGMIFNGKVVGSGFEHVPGGDAFQNRSALSFHYYCASFDPGWEKQPVWRRVVCDSVVAPLVFRAVQEDTARLGGALIMTEGLACDGTRAPGECEAVMGKLDQHLVSWTDYGDSQGPTWQPSAAQQAAWARTFARAIAGQPERMSFDPVTKAFELCFRLDVGIPAPTEIFASRSYSYPNGMEVSATGNLRVNASEGDIIHITPAGTARTGSRGCVSIKRAGPVAWV